MPEDVGTPKWWLAQVEERQKALEREWLEDARKYVGIYDAGEKRDKVPFNILFSNTETLLPTLFNSLPRPDVSRRHTQTDPKRRQVDAAVQQATERQLEYFVDSNQGDYDDFDDGIVQAVVSALVPGLGQLRVRLHQEGGFQKICPQVIHYDRFVWSYARTWSQVRWVAFGHDLTKEDLKKQFPEFAKTEDFKAFDWRRVSEQDESDKSEDQRKGRQGTFLVWEIEDAQEQQIHYVCPAFGKSFLHEEAYPVSLTARFSCPKPLVFKRRVGELLPVPLYKMYQKQAEELNDVTRRIASVIRACKVRGIYNSILGDLQKALESADAVFIASEQAMALTQDGLDKQIWMMPVEKIVQVLVQLYTAQQNCKTVIYEIMGIADIQRGASVASETARAQEIKNAWGTLRVKRAQRLVSVFCRDILRIAAELAAGAFTSGTWRSVTQLPYLLRAEKESLQMMASRPEGAMLAQQAQQGDPQAATVVQQSQYMLSLPTWEEIIEVLQNSFQRSFRIDIETNSTVDLEATEDKQSIAEFMNAFGQMTAGLTPLVEAQVLPFPAAKAIMAETFRKFRFGRKVQDALDLMQPPQPRQDSEAKDQMFKAQQATKDATHAAEKEQWSQTVTGLKAQIAQLQIDKAGVQHQAGVREGELKADARGKLQLQEQKISQNAQAVQEKELDMNLQQAQAAVQQMVSQAQTSIQQMVREAVGQIQQLATDAAHAQQLSKTEAQAQESGVQKALAAIQEGQRQMAEAMAALAKAQQAPRKRTLMVDEKGNKSVIDEMVQH